MTRNHFSKKNIGPYFISDHPTDKEIKVEDYVYRVYRSILSLPRRFWQGLKKYFDAWLHS